MKLIINLFALVIIASGLDEDAVKELKCSAVSSPDSGIDLKWVTTYLCIFEMGFILN